MRKYRIRLFRSDGWEVGEPEEFEGLEEAQEQARFFLSTGEAYRVDVEKWEKELHGEGWYRVWWTIEDKKGKEQEMGKQKSEIKLSKVALGQLIQVATDQRQIRDITPGALAELAGAGMLTKKYPQIQENQTLEWQIQRNREALAKLAHWARNACPKNPFKGGPLDARRGYMGNRGLVDHPAAEAWDQIQKPQEYKSCPQTVLSDTAWELLKDLGMDKPKAGDEKKPCASR